MDFFGKVKRFAGDHLKSALSHTRDNVLVPAIDSAMEAGVIPAAHGMYGRYLTGTEVPLTKMPADIKKAEQEMTSTHVDPNNYHNTGYNNVDRMGGLAGVNATTNSLGQYSVQGGIIKDRYDFDDNNGFGDPDQPKPFYKWDGKFDHSGIFGEGEVVQQLTRGAGRLSHDLGLIKPGSGYDVRLDTGRR